MALMQKYIPTSSHQAMIPITGEGGYYFANDVDKRIEELESAIQFYLNHPQRASRSTTVSICHRRFIEVMNNAPREGK